MHHTPLNSLAQYSQTCLFASYQTKHTQKTYDHQPLKTNHNANLYEDVTALATYTPKFLL